VRRCEQGRDSGANGPEHAFCAPRRRRVHAPARYRGRTRKTALEKRRPSSA
jgi:hypothetical protein